MGRRLGIALLLAGLMLAAVPAQPWGNGASGSATYPYYGVHDALAHVAYERLRGAQPEAATFLGHWFLAAPGGYGASFNPLHLWPQGSDNFLGYTDDPDSDLQDWCNHLYLVHPRAGHDDQCAPARAAELMGQMRANLTAWMATGRVPCSLPEHAAAFQAGLLAHYVGDLSQFGHTDYTSKDHSHPASDPSDRTYHGYYESEGWGSTALSALLADLRGRPYAQRHVDDVEAAVVAFAKRVNMPDGVTVTYSDLGGPVSVGSQYKTMLTSFVQDYDAGVRFNGVRGYDAALWATTMANLDADAALLADLYATAWTDAAAALPLLLPPVQAAAPNCPAA